MLIDSQDYAMSLLAQGQENFTFPVKPNIISRFQLLFTGKAINGVELFGIGPNEIRAFGFLVEFHEIINIEYLFIRMAVIFPTVLGFFSF